MRWRPALLIASLMSSTWARAPPATASAALSARSSRRCMASIPSGHRLELARVHMRLVELEPRGGLAVERELQPLPQRLAVLGIVGHPLLHVAEADAAEVGGRAGAAA